MHYDIPSPQRIDELKQLITGTQTKQVNSSEDDGLERPMSKEELVAIVDYNLQNL